MFAKIVTVILVLGFMYGALLVNRQRRIDAASEISRIHFRVQELEQEKVRLQVRVAELTTVTELRKRFGEERLAGYASVPFRHDPARAVDDRMGDPLATAPDGATTGVREKSTANKAPVRKKKEIG
jgi:hypothetical protein